MYTENLSAQQLVKNPVHHSWSKHIDIRVWLCKRYSSGRADYLKVSFNQSGDCRYIYKQLSETKTLQAYKNVKFLLKYKIRAYNEEWYWNYRKNTVTSSI